MKMTFKFRGKKYKIRKGGNLHAALVLLGMFSTVIVGYVLLCMFVGIGNSFNL